VQAQGRDAARSAGEKLEDEALAALLNFPGLLPDAACRIGPLHFQEPARRRLYEAIVHVARTGADPQATDVMNFIDDPETRRIAQGLLDTELCLVDARGRLDGALVRLVERPEDAEIRRRTSAAAPSDDDLAYITEVYRRRKCA